MNRFILTVLLAAGLTSFTISPLVASNLVNNAGNGGLTYFSDTVGYEFTVGSQSLSVTALGFYKDSNSSLYSAPTVGIWNTGGTLLASLNIPLNSFNDGSYLWSNLSSPITLDSSTTYLIGAFVGNYNGAYMRNGYPTLSDDVSLVGTARNGSQWVFSAPSLISPSSQGIVGPNMQYTAIPNATPSLTPPTGGGDVIPEPSTYALFGLGTLALIVAYRRRVA